MPKTKKTHVPVIPKRIAGVKVPKKVRKGPFGELLASRTGQAVIAQAIFGPNQEPAATPSARRRARTKAAQDAEAMQWTPDYGAPEATAN
jgi:hypothetical protein